MVVYASVSFLTRAFMPKINSLRKVIQILEKTGTGKEKIQAIQTDSEGKSFFPIDRKTGAVVGDALSSKGLDRAEELHDLWFDTQEGLPAIPTLTLDKIKSIIAVGEYIPQSMFQEDFPVEFEDGEDEDLPPPTNATPAAVAVIEKKKGGRPKGSKNAPKAVSVG